MRIHLTAAEVLQAVRALLGERGLSVGTVDISGGVVTANASVILPEQTKPEPIDQP